jgi:hypothetical protein
MSIIQTILIASGVVGALALLLYFVPVSKLRVPAIALGAVAGVGVGAAIGMVATMLYGDTVLAEYRGPGVEGAHSKNGGGGGGGRGGSATGGLSSEKTSRNQSNVGGAPPPGKAAGGQSAKTQLVQLVTKLEALATKSLVIDLTPEQKKKLLEKLAGVEDESELSIDEAKRRLDDLLEVFKDQKATLEAAGYRWPSAPAGRARADGRGASGGGGAMGKGQPNSDVPNPFKEGPNNDHLKSLRSVAAPGDAKS